MSRIRSIHPGQWTDEDFVECSPFARLLNLGIRNEADDNGVFEWRATRLKMRLFPADPIDVGELLDELEGRGLILRFEVGGRPYGAIRNFRVYQNPRSPKAEHPITPEVERFVGDRAGEDAPSKRGPGRPRKSHSVEIDEAQPKSIPQSGENNPLMERERREEKDNSPSDSSIGEPIDVRSEPPPAALSLLDEVGPAFAAYQDLRSSLAPGCRPLALSPERRRGLAARLREVGGPGGWADVLSRIRGSAFLRGETSRDGRFVAEIDWLLKPANLRKVMEGNYDDRPAQGRRDPGSSVAATARAAIAAGLG